jgi:hypothetical protein
VQPEQAANLCVGKLGKVGMQPEKEVSCSKSCGCAELAGQPEKQLGAE